MPDRLVIALLTGDRSLVDVVVHELTHSWFGNGVTYVFPDSRILGLIT